MTLLFICPSLTYALFATAWHCWLMYSFWFTVTPDAFSQNCFVISCPHPIFEQLIMHQWQLCTDSSWIASYFFSDCSCNLSRSFCITMLSSKAVAIPPGLVPSADIMQSIFCNKSIGYCWLQDPLQTLFQPDNVPSRCNFEAWFPNLFQPPAVMSPGGYSVGLLCETAVWDSGKGLQNQDLWLPCLQELSHFHGMEFGRFDFIYPEQIHVVSAAHLQYPYSRFLWTVWLFCSSVFTWTEGKMTWWSSSCPSILKTAAVFALLWVFCKPLVLHRSSGMVTDSSEILLRWV